MLAIDLNRLQICSVFRKSFTIWLLQFRFLKILFILKNVFNLYRKLPLKTSPVSAKYYIAFIFRHFFIVINAHNPQFLMVIISLLSENIKKKLENNGKRMKNTT